MWTEGVSGEENNGDDWGSFKRKNEVCKKFEDHRWTLRENDQHFSRLRSSSDRSCSIQSFHQIQSPTQFDWWLRDRYSDTFSDLSAPRLTNSVVIRCLKAEYGGWIWIFRRLNLKLPSGKPDEWTWWEKVRVSDEEDHMMVPDRLTMTFHLKISHFLIRFESLRV